MLVNDSDYFEMKKFESTEELEDYQKSEDLDNQLCFAIEFNTYDSEAQNYNLSIRYAPQFLPNDGDSEISDTTHYHPKAYQNYTDLGMLAPSVSVLIK